jgi:hypothetical protein
MYTPQPLPSSWNMPPNFDEPQQNPSICMLQPLIWPYRKNSNNLTARAKPEHLYLVPAQPWIVPLPPQNMQSYLLRNTILHNLLCPVAQSLMWPKLVNTGFLEKLIDLHSHSLSVTQLALDDQCAHHQPPQ